MSLLFCICDLFRAQRLAVFDEHFLNAFSVSVVYRESFRKTRPFISFHHILIESTAWRTIKNYLPGDSADLGSIVCVHDREQGLRKCLALICRSKQPMVGSVIALRDPCTEKIQCPQPKLGVAVTCTSQRLRPSRGSYRMDLAPFLMVVEVGTSM